MKVVVTGAAGFIGGYIMRELAMRGHEAIGLDNYSRYPREQVPGVVCGDVKDTELLAGMLLGGANPSADYLIAGAAMIGGIEYFHRLPYDLIAENDRIIASTCDAAIQGFLRGQLARVVYVSSSMVYESAPEDFIPSAEGDELQIPPPASSYGFQKLAVEYYARALWDQYKVPYTIVRPFNCVGVGEAPKMSHVIPDLVRKVLSGQDPLEIYGDGGQLRHYTHGVDLARGIVDAMESPATFNEDVNLASPEGHTVHDVAEMIWHRIRGPQDKLRLAHAMPFPHDVRRRSPDVSKAFRLLRWTADIRLGVMLDEVIAHYANEAIHPRHELEG